LQIGLGFEIASASCRFGIGLVLSLAANPSQDGKTKTNIAHH